MESEEDGRTTDATIAAGNINTPRANQIAPTQVDGAAVPPKPSLSTNFTGNLFKILLFVHLLAIAILVTFLSIRASLSKTSSSHSSHHYYTPLLTSAILSFATSLLWTLLTLRHPTIAIKSSLWISPTLACFAAVLLLADGTGSSLAFAAVALALSVALGFYSCWIAPRVLHACRVLSASIGAAGPSIAMGKYVVFVLIAALVYSCFWILGVGGVAAAGGTGFDAVYVLLLVLSLAWTTQVLHNIVHVAVSTAAHARLSHRPEVGAREAFQRAAGHALGSVCFGSAVMPLIGLARGTARVLGSVSVEPDEFLFSCAACCSGVADWLVVYGNRWGFVQVGVYGKGFAKASRETWEMFGKQGMRRLVDLDVTGYFCLLCGVAGGAMSALVGGSWVLAVEEGYATGVTAYAFLVGYFMFRIAMAWPLACVSAYHVAYAENPRNPILGSIIPDWIRELESSPD